MKPMTFWDIAAGILVAFGLIAGIIRGSRSQADRPMLYICAGLAIFIVLFRGACWHGLACEVDGHPKASELSARYGLTP